MKYFLHLLKSIKLFIYNPISAINWFIEDYKKDRNAKSYSSKVFSVWCAGLPKSGTTLIERIFDQLPYVRLDASILRVFYSKNLDHDHGINEEIFMGMKKGYYTFLKTHSHYNKNYEQLATNHKVKIIISLRDLRDMMISRYFHIKNDKHHWLYNELYKLDFKNGFKKSLVSMPKNTKELPLHYYYFWIKNWLKISEEKKYLVLWYEDYISNPLEYIEKILKYIEFKYISKEKIYESIKINTKNNLRLDESLKQYSKLKSTFRKGEVGSWKKYFDDDILNFFNEHLPEPIEKIIYRNK